MYSVTTSESHRFRMLKLRSGSRRGAWLVQHLRCYPAWLSGPYWTFKMVQFTATWYNGNILQWRFLSNCINTEILHCMAIRLSPGFCSSSLSLDHDSWSWHWPTKKLIRYWGWLEQLEKSYQQVSWPQSCIYASIGCFSYAEPGSVLMIQVTSCDGPNISEVCC